MIERTNERIHEKKKYKTKQILTTEPNWKSKIKTKIKHEANETYESRNLMENNKE